MTRPGPLLIYTSARLALFVVVLFVLYLFGMRRLLLLVVAVLVSGLLSYPLLARLRDAVSISMVNRGQSMRGRFRSRTAAEDAVDDAQRGVDGTVDPSAPAVDPAAPVVDDEVGDTGSAG